MGCSAAANTQYQTNTENNFVSLVVADRTDLLIEKIEQMGQSFNCNAPINFRGDTLLHYACAKNNVKLVNYLVGRPETMRARKNKLGLRPHDLTQNLQIRQLLS